MLLAADQGHLGQAGQAPQPLALLPVQACVPGRHPQTACGAQRQHHYGGRLGNSSRFVAAELACATVGHHFGRGRHAGRRGVNDRLPHPLRLDGRQQPRRGLGQDAFPPCPLLLRGQSIPGPPLAPFGHPARREQGLRHCHDRQNGHRP